MTFPSFNPIFGLNPIQPSQVGYSALALAADTTLVWPLEAMEGANIATLIINVTPSASSLNLTLPPANQVSVGQSILIRNVSVATTFDVKDADGTVVVSIATGTAYFLYLTDNDSEAGVWSVLVFGGTSAPVNPAALAGAGLTVISSMLATNIPVATQSATFTLTAGRATGQIYTGGAGTCNLPAVASAPNGFWFGILNLGSGTLSIDPNGAELINGGATIDLAVGESAIIVSSGIAWYTLSLSRSIAATITRLVLVLTGGTRALSSTEAGNALIYCTGVLGSNQIITFPASAGRWFVSNATTGAYTLNCQVTGGGDPGTTIPQAEQQINMSDGTNMIPAQTTTPIAPTSFGNGLVGSPSIFLTATNTGIYFPAGNASIAMATGGVQFFLASASGISVNSISLVDGSGNIPWARISAAALPQIQAAAASI